MLTSEQITTFVRLLIFAAGIAALPIAYRSGGRWRTYVVLICGLLSVSIPPGAQMLQSLLGDRFILMLSTLSQLRVEEPGYATILVGLLLGLRDMHRFKGKLLQECLTLKREASTDYLTGLLSRRQAELLLEHGAARARRSKSPLGFIMIDLDHFKEVNDTHGHQAGDAVLAHIGAILKNRLRASDIVSRYGGEEFLVVVLDPNPDTLLPLAESLRQLIEEKPATHGKLEIPVRASFGVALCQVENENDVKEAIHKADQALYMAKAQGRNRVVSWDHISSPARESAASLAQKN